MILALLLFMGIVETGQSYVCWSDEAVNDYGQTESITRCRVAGRIVDYGSESDVPLYLYADVGSAANGTCWFWRSSWSGWEILTRYADGNATLGYDSDGTPGGPLNLEVTYPVCISEPVDTDPLEVLAWDLVREYVHQRPQPEINPEVPLGLTGAGTYIALDPPGPFAAAIVSPLGGLEVEAWVGAVTIDWGDGDTVNLPPEAFPLITGYPDGVAQHTYEVKTCDPPGSGPRCHPTLLAYDLEARYQWQVRWRVGGGDWQPLAVPDSITAVAYPVQEVISVLGSSS